MNIFSPSRAARLRRHHEGDGVPIVDARGRLTGIRVTDRDIRAAWRAARGTFAGGTLRVRSLPLDEALEDLDLIANDVSVFFVQADGVVCQWTPEDREEVHLRSLDGSPLLGPADVGAFMAHAARAEGYARREESESFEDHYRRATVLWMGLSVHDRAHLVLAARFALGKVENEQTWRRAIAQFRRVDGELARRVARSLRVHGTGSWNPKGDDTVAMTGYRAPSANGA